MIDKINPIEAISNSNEEQLRKYWKETWAKDSQKMISQNIDEAFHSEEKPMSSLGGYSEELARKQRNAYSDASPAKRQEIDFAKIAIQQYILILAENAKKIIQKIQEEASKPQFDQNKIRELDHKFSDINQEMSSVNKIISEVKLGKFKIEKQRAGSVRIDADTGIGILAGHASDSKENELLREKIYKALPQNNYLRDNFSPSKTNKQKK